jgi:hypothetical protein
MARIRFTRYIGSKTNAIRSSQSYGRYALLLDDREVFMA